MILISLINTKQDNNPMHYSPYFIHVILALSTVYTPSVFAMKDFHKRTWEEFSNYSPDSDDEQNPSKKVKEEVEEPLIDAVTKLTARRIILQLKKGVYINFRALSNGDTALHRAVRRNKANFLKILLSYGSHPHISNNDGDTPLDLANKLGFTELALQLEEHQKWLNKELSYLIRNNDLDDAQQLITRGAQLDQHDFHYAVEKNFFSMVQLLIDEGADINYTSGLQTTFLITASKHGYDKLVELFLSNNACTEEQDLHGETALYIACSSGRLPVVKKLIEYGADLFKANNYGQMPMGAAETYKQAAVLKYLKGMLSFFKEPNKVGFIINQKNAYELRISAYRYLINHPTRFSADLLKLYHYFCHHEPSSFLDVLDVVPDCPKELIKLPHNVIDNFNVWGKVLIHSPSNENILFETDIIESLQKDGYSSETIQEIAKRIKQAKNTLLNFLQKCTDIDTEMQCVICTLVHDLFCAQPITINIDEKGKFSLSKVEGNSYQMDFSLMNYKDMIIDFHFSGGHKRNYKAFITFLKENWIDPLSLTLDKNMSKEEFEAFRTITDKLITHEKLGDYKENYDIRINCLRFQ